MFSEKTYIDRRNRLKNDVGNGIILLLGNEESGMNYRDNTYRFRQDSTFLYFFGISSPSLAAIIDCDSGEEYIIGNEFSMDDIIWMGPQKKLSELAKQVGISKIISPNSLVDKLKKAPKIHFLPPYRPENSLKLSEYLGINLNEISVKVSTKLIMAVIAQRSIKSTQEIVQIEDAINITREMHMAAMQATKPTVKEYEVVAAIYAKAISLGAELAYPVIFSINGQTLHNHAHTNNMPSGRLVLNDSGAENTMSYAGDITRTFPVDKKFTSEQKDIYQVVLSMEMAAIQALMPKKQYKEIHLLANKVMLDSLKSLDFLKGDTDEMLNEGVQGLFMPHGLGHSIGLDVHDMEDLGEQYVGYREGLERSTQLGLKSLRLAKELEVGNVLTVEPGIYFIPELIQKWEAEGKFKEFINYQKLHKFKNFGGIRIEDNCLITPDGGSVLGKPIPKTIVEIENFRA